VLVYDGQAIVGIVSSSDIFDALLGSSGQAALDNKE
jgi:CBS domain-containing protein